MIALGLTGSIGMGKTTTAKMFAEEGIPVHDADAVVHDLYRGEAVAPIAAAFPGSVRDGTVDRAELAHQLAGDPEKLRRLESIVHPLVRRREADFLERHRRAGQDIVLLDIPLLYETGAEARVDSVVVVSCAAEIQRARVLARPGMTEEKFALLLSRQLADAEKRRRADFVIDTGDGLEPARQRVRAVLAALREGRMSEQHA